MGRPFQLSSPRLMMISLFGDPLMGWTTTVVVAIEIGRGRAATTDISMSPKPHETLRSSPGAGCGRPRERRPCVCRCESALATAGSGKSRAKVGVLISGLAISVWVAGGRAVEAGVGHILDKSGFCPAICSLSRAACSATVNLPETKGGQCRSAAPARGRPCRSCALQCRL